MKKSLLFVLWIAGVLVFSSCVTKQKYMELEAKYKACSDDLNYNTSEKLTYEAKSQQLAQEVAQLSDRVRQLKEDTISLSRKLTQSERNLVKLKVDYSDLMKSFTNLNKNNNKEMANLMVRIDSISSELDARERELAEKEKRLEELQNILENKDLEVRNLKDKVTNALKGFIDNGLNVHEKNGKVYVSMDEKLLFASGSWVVGEQGLVAIKELAKILESDTTINILIEGHTDNVPYKGNSQVKDNWDLSVMRATSVVKALLKDSSIAPERISAAGRGEFVPVEENITPEARAKNRRTEIILTPKLDELFKIIENN